MQLRTKTPALKGGLWWSLLTLLIGVIVSFAAITSRALYPDIKPAQVFIHLAQHGMPLIIGGILSILSGGAVTLIMEILKKQGNVFAKTYPSVLPAVICAILVLVIFQKRSR